jgi:16S rRNA (guanine1207-N2)-methyltransferase
MTTDQLRQDIVFTTSLRDKPLTFHSTWGLFSPKAVDEGTMLLVKYLDIKSDDVTLDLGCGYGPLGLPMAQMAPNGRTHLVDKDFVAVDYAAKNAALNGISNTQAYLSNGFDQIPTDQMFDVIASNIPAKIGGEQLQILLEDAFNHLSPKGKLYIVTISGLKEFMKRHLSEKFGNYTKLKQSKTYTAALAVKR